MAGLISACRAKRFGWGGPHPRPLS